MLFVDFVGSEILPKDEGLIVVKHSGYYSEHRNLFPYDRNANSSAFIPHTAGDVYVQGCFNGGKVVDFKLLIREIMENTQKDLDNGIMALWHDESHLNKYIITRKYKLLSPSYAYPEGLNLPFDKKIIIRDKNIFGGHDFLRGLKTKKIIKLKKIFNKIRSLI